MSTELEKSKISTRMTYEIKNNLRNKYFNVFMNKFDIEGIDDYDTEEFILKRLFYKGQVAVFDLKGVGPVACDFTVHTFGLNHRPVGCQMVTTDYVPNFPKGLLTSGVDCVLGYINSSKSPINEDVNYHINRLTDLYMALFVNLQLNKLPFVITGEPEQIELFNMILDRIYSNELAVFASSQDVAQLKVLNTGAPYLVDKLWTQILNEESDLLSCLGIDCNSINMNRVTVDQVNANNNFINNINKGYNRHLQRFTDKINELFGVNWSIKVAEEKVESIHNEEYNEDSEVVENEQEVI